MTNKTIERAKEKAAISYKVKKSFIGRNFYLFYGVILVYIAASLWSMTTAAGNIYLRVAAMLGENVWSILAAAIGGISIVGLQFVSGKGAVDDLQIGILKTAPDGEAMHSLGDRVFFFLKAAGFIAATTISIILSIDGVGTANDFFRNEKRPFQEQVADVSFYDQQIARLNENIAQEQTRKWKGVLTTDASRRIAKYEAKKDRLLNERAAVLADVAAENATRLAQYDAKTESNESALKGVGGVAEVVIIFCVIFIGLYDDGLYREAGVKKGAPVAAPAGIGFGRATQPAPVSNQVQQQPTPEAYRSTQIGFNVRNSVAQQTRPVIAQQQPTQQLVNTGNFVAPAQQKAQQPKRNTGATKNPLYLSARSAIRNARTAIKKAQRDYENGAIDAEQLAAIITTKQDAITRNEKKAAQLKNRKA